MSSRALQRVLTSVRDYSHGLIPQRRLRGYQLPIAEAITRSIDTGAGEQFAAVFSRQSGKDEMAAQLIAYLLTRYQRQGGSIIVALPAISTQGAVALDRLMSCLDHPLARGAVRQGMTVRLGAAFVRYISASPQANSRGQTASLLLLANEAQDIETEVWDSRFAPMAASTNATTLYMGTTWTDQGLLSREMRYLSSLEAQDGRKRVYLSPWRTVAAELPAYRAYVESQIDKLGPDHPFIKTEYELTEMGAAGALFPPERADLMRGSFPAEVPPPPPTAAGIFYVMTVDVAGEEEELIEGEPVTMHNKRRDSTAVSVWRCTSGSRRDENTYQLVARYVWTGVKISTQHTRIVELFKTWRAERIVVDATGVGRGITSFLGTALGEHRVLPYVFTLASKSLLGWEFVGMVDAGRVKVFDGSDDHSRQFWKQVAAVRYSILPGPQKHMRWSVPDPNTHDDLIVSAALIAALDMEGFRSRTAKGRA